MSGPTERLYYLDPALTEFEATVASATRVGDRAAVTLDRTAFYPTSGGQPFDTGSLGEARVIEVVEDEAGEVLHVLDRPIPVGEAVRGRIDRARRLDHMQQHTGQHILSSALDRLARARTVGFHLGADVSTVDLDVPIPAGAIAAAEDDANRVVWEDRAVSIRLVSDAEAAVLPLRKETGRTGTLRVIEVEGYDCSACGGTHVTRTGSVGMIAVLSAERLRGGVRLEFVCGRRALRQMRTYRDAVAGCIRSVSVAPSDLPAAVERLQAEAKEQRKVARDLQERLAVHEAREVAEQAEPLSDGTRQVVRVVETADQNVLKAMALAVCARPGYRVALFSSTAPHLVVVARSKEVSADAAAVLKSLFATFGGRGGGRPDLAQGGGLNGPADALLAHARGALSEG
ncbi:MAG TPA: DHHA1 domain-containing protein [Vicinamibacterales bacterium]|nr:DHHA1 domain-containing protein [Vicinamibacterales bacterium]